MRSRFELTENTLQPSSHEKNQDVVLAMRRAGAAVIAGTLALTLVGCKEGAVGSRDYEPGTIEETQERLADTVLVECIDGTAYDLDGKGAQISDEHFGKYRKGRTNLVVEITPESGGETLLLEQESNVFARPQELVISPLTNQDILKDVGCGPADLPGDKDDYVITYNVKKNTKALKDHGLIK